MDLGVISVRYAKALLKSALTLKVEDKVYQEMRSLSESFLKVPQLRHTIDNPTLADEKKQALIEAACGQQPCELTRKFIALVLKEDRENTLQFMAASFITLYRANKNIIRGRLITAAAVSPETEQKMRHMVEMKTQGTVEFQSEVDPDIIGGFILEYGTYRMDASVKSKLTGILSQLKK